MAKDHTVKARYSILMLINGAGDDSPDVTHQIAGFLILLSDASMEPEIIPRM